MVPLTSSTDAVYLDLYVPKEKKIRVILGIKCFENDGSFRRESISWS